MAPKRPSLTNVFEGLDLKAPADYTSPPSSPIKRAKIRHDLRQTIRSGWPTGLGSASKSQMHSMAFTISASSVYRTYAEDQDPAKLFEKASRWLTTIRELEMDNNYGHIVETEIIKSMTAALFGSNQIERAGLGLNITTQLCERVFRGEVVEDFDERDEGYESRLQQMINAQQDLADKSATHILRSRREVVQHAKAFYYMIYAIVIENEPLTEDLIKKVHGILCKNVPIVHHDGNTTDWRSYAGKYRNIPVAAGNTMFTTPNMIPRAMQSFINEYEKDVEQMSSDMQIDPFAFAAKYCLNFVQIHPFQDGNGRMCRIILNALLCRYAGVIIPIGEREEERTEYLDIKKRASAEMEGPGELATFVLRKATTRLRATKQKLAGKN